MECVIECVVSSKSSAAPADMRSVFLNVCVFLVAGISPAGAGEVEQ